MKAMVMRRRNGGIDALEMAEWPVPQPAAGQVLVRVHASSVNDWDWGLLAGDANWAERTLSRLVSSNGPILGCDVAGRVAAVGEGVVGLREGDEVYGDLCASGFGAFAEYVCAPATALARKPAGMSFEQAAAIPQAAMLAVQGLVDAGQIRPGSRVLLNGAGGGVGTFALQVAKVHGAEVTAVDKASKLGVLRDLGADHLVDYLEQDFTQGERHYDLILDARTTRAPGAYARVLRPGGRYVTVGGSLPRLLQASLARRFARVVNLKPNKDLDYVNRLFEAGQLRPVIEGPYPLERLREAFELFARSDHKGKIVVTMA